MKTTQSIAKWLLLIITITVTNHRLHAQNLIFSFRSGIGSYAMTDLKANQDNLIDQLPVMASKTDEFPSYFVFGLDGLYSLTNTLFVGVSFDYQSTGGRIAYSDFSGDIKIDHKINAPMIAATLQKRLVGNESFSLLGELKAGLLFTDFSISSRTLIGTSVTKEIIEFTGLSPTAGMKMVLRKGIGPFFLQAGVGFMLDFGSEIKLKDEDAILINNNGDPAKTGWGGLRADFGIGIRIRGN